MAGKTDPGAEAAAATAKIDAYLASLPSDQRDALQSLRETIAAAAPEAVEGLSYGIPAFRYRSRPLVSYLAATKHLGFYPMSPKVVDHFRDELKDFSLAKSTVRFTTDHPIPSDLVRRIVRARIGETDAAAAVKGTGSR
jgi:uncharacterized protein YdhG (YjbR/CyaY superfamily)